MSQVPRTPLSRFRGLDSLRFVAALWVMMEHGALPPLTVGFDHTNPWAHALNGLWNGSISGPAAVIVFFVISGFCIHLPFEQGKALRLVEFWSRRGVRILVPMVGAIFLARCIPGVSSSSDFLSGIPAWSLVCEIIYYAIYPLLLHMSRHVPFKVQFFVAFMIALLLASTKPISNVNYPAWGYALDWILGLPCWMLGVLLAKSAGNLGSAPTPVQIWILRFMAAALGALTHHLALQRIVGQHITLNFFALFCFYWVKREIAYYADARRPWPVLEWAGKWSYSLYLVHISAFFLFHLMEIPMFGYFANWLLVMTWVVLLSVVFFYAVEKPSHWLARVVGSRASDHRLSINFPIPQEPL